MAARSPDPCRERNAKRSGRTHREPAISGVHRRARALPCDVLRSTAALKRSFDDGRLDPIWTSSGKPISPGTWPRRSRRIWTTHPPLAHQLRFTTLPWLFFTALVLFTIVYLVLVEITRMVFYAGPDSPSRTATSHARPKKGSKFGRPFWASSMTKSSWSAPTMRTAVDMSFQGRPCTRPSGGLCGRCADQSADADLLRSSIGCTQSVSRRCRRAHPTSASVSRPCGTCSPRPSRVRHRRWAARNRSGSASLEMVRKVCRYWRASGQVVYGRS
jgi:hypothetical protein